MKTHFLKILTIFLAILFLAACQSDPPPSPAVVESPTDASTLTPIDHSTCKKILYLFHNIHGPAGPLDNLVAGCPFDPERRILATETFGAAWSPDGTEIAMLSTKSGNGQLYLMLPDGSNMRQLTFGPDLINSDWLWMPDGGRIALLYRPPYRGMDEEDEGEATEPPTEIPFEPVWQALNLTTLELSPLPGWTAPGLFEYHPALSHDRTRMAYEVYSEELGGSQIYVSNLDGSEESPLITDIPTGNITWFPGDTRLAFWVDLSGTREQFAIFAINTDGSGFTRLSEHNFDYWPSMLVSPDGYSLVVLVENTVYHLDLESDELTELFYVEEPTWISIQSWQP